MEITFLWVLCVALIVLGLAGTVLHVPPGSLLVWAGIALDSWIDDFVRVSVTAVMAISMRGLFIALVGVTAAALLI